MMQEFIPLNHFIIQIFMREMGYVLYETETEFFVANPDFQLQQDEMDVTEGSVNPCFPLFVKIGSFYGQKSISAHSMEDVLNTFAFARTNSTEEAINAFEFAKSDLQGITPSLVLSLIATLMEQLDSFVWDAFRKYIKANGIHFSSPEYWSVNGNVVDFSGYNGCRGCYDRMSITINIDFFDDVDANINAIIATKEAENEKKRLAAEKREEEAEKALLQKLLQKHGNIQG